jgi:hypothetical protein
MIDLKRLLNLLRSLTDENVPSELPNPVTYHDSPREIDTYRWHIRFYVGRRRAKTGLNSC